MHKEIEDAISKLENEAYQRGWNAAIASIMAAAKTQGIPKPEVSQSNPALPAIGLFRTRSAHQAGPREGSTVDMTLKYVQNNPGSIGIEIVKALQAQKDSIEERTVRTAFMRLKKRRLIEQREGRWYPI